MNAPVRLDNALVTLVDPNRGSEVAFNRWYERDHFYGGALLGPGVFAGGRFLARDTEKRLRVAPEDADPNANTMLAAYWLTGDGADYWRWCTEAVPALTAAGRMSPPGRVREAMWWPRPWTAAADAERTPAELALDRRFPAAALTFVEATGELDAEALAADYRACCVQPLLGEGTAGIAVGAVPQPVTPGAAPRPGTARLATLWFLPAADAPADFVAAHEKAMTDLPGAHTAWLSPYVAAVPGTDEHLDRLWL